MMHIGIDLGASAVKMAVLEGGKLVYRAYVGNGDGEPAEILDGIQRRHAFHPDAVALTGVGAAALTPEALWPDCPVKRVLEVEAIAAGTRFLTGLEEFLSVSIGTGTAFVLARGGETTHIGGSAFGGGALQGLSRKILGGGVRERLTPLCAGGDLSRVDLLMSELPSCPPTLDPTMTAANLVKTDGNTSPEDWAIGILNAVVQTIGSMAFLSASAHGAEHIVFTGGPTSIPETAGIIDAFNRIYPHRFLVPENADCCTAIGAARLCGGEI